MAAARLVWATLSLLLAALVALPAGGQTFPKFTGLVVDAANVLPQATRDDLTKKLEALQHDTNRQLVVATIPSLEGYPIEDYGYKLGRAWGVGLKDVNNGAILFIAPNEPAGHRGPRIEVGKGLEPIVTDALSSVIINQQMIPKLRAKDIPGAMEAGTDALIQQLRASPEEAGERTAQAVKEFNAVHQRSRSGGGGGIPLGLVFWLFVLGIIGLSWLRRGGGGSYHRGGNWPIVLWGLADAMSSSNRGGGWSGSDGGGGGGGSDGSWGGGGFTGGGGGDFGGGGASGDW